MLEAQLAAAGTSTALIDENLKTQLEALDIEEAAIKRLTAEKIRELQREADARKKLTDAIVGNINQGIDTIVMKIADNFAEGNSLTDGLTEAFGGVVKNIRNTLLKQTVIEPLQNSISGFFGGSKKGADNLTFKGDNLLVTDEAGMGVAEQISSGVGKEAEMSFGVIKNKLTEFGGSVLQTFTNLGTNIQGIFRGVGSFIQQALQGIMGGGGGGGLLKGIGSIFTMGGDSSIFDGLFGGPGLPFASGGSVRHMAQGGQVNALRDRVPAMLEPGEFVLRKQAARNIGSSNLHAMNSGTGGMPKITINLENSGQGKEAEQQGQPKFDTDKLVVDVVLRDIRSNGPIRKAIRSGET